MSRELHVGDVGTVLTFTLVDDGVAVDLKATNDKKLTFTKPDQTPVQKTAAFVTDGGDGKIKYVTEADFFDQAGLWRVQAYVAWATGNQWSSDVGSFQVYPNLEAPA